MSNLYGYNTSSAFKVEIGFDSYGNTDNRRLHTNDKDNKTAERTRTAAKKHSAFNVANFLRVAICFAVAFVIVNGYVKINEARGRVTQLEKQYNEIVAANQDLQVKIDKAIDLEQLQTVANENFGMVRPERYQMFYVDMEQGDASEIYAKKDGTKKKVAMNGVTGTITSAMNIFK